MKSAFKLLFLLLILGSPAAHSAQLVSDATIALQKQNTEVFTLSSQVPVIYRHIEGTEIFQIATVLALGKSQMSAEKQPAFNMLFDLMERGSKTWPKEKLFGIMEKYATSVNCGVSIEISACSMATLESNLTELMPVYASVILEPALDPNEAQLIFKQTEAGLKAMSQNPESYVNEIVNSAFYGSSHPYWIPKDKEHEYLQKFDLKNLGALHQEVFKTSRKVIVVVAGMPTEELKKLLEKNLSAIPQGNSQLTAPVMPKFEPKRVFAIGDRDIPTAYLRAKFALPSITSPDAPAVSLLMRILSEELESEVRTKRSLSYAVYAQAVSLTMGLGVLHASTSHPKETLEAIVPVIQKLRDKKLSVKELDRHKTVFATGYFLTLEEHSSLAGTLASTWLYFGNTDRLYQTPRELEKVTPEDIQRIAKKYLTQFRLGVVYKEKEFKKAWADQFLKTLNRG